MATSIVAVRPFAPQDLDALYEISLITGHAGGDATALHLEPRLIGEIYSAPYALLEPAWAFVAEDDEGIGGYIVGTHDTRRFEARLEKDWWPPLRARHAEPTGNPETWTPDELRVWLIHHPRLAPDDVVDPFPGHLHMNLHPRLQGRGLGGRLLDAWFTAAASAGLVGVHLGASPQNERAIAYWSGKGFSRLARENAKPRSTVWFGRSLAAPKTQAC